MREDGVRSVSSPVARSERGKAKRRECKDFKGEDEVEVMRQKVRHSLSLKTQTTYSCQQRLALSLLILVCNRCGLQRSVGHRGQLVLFLRRVTVLLHGDPHVAPITTLPAISFVLTDATFSANTGVLAPATGALAIATLLALAAPLAARLRGQVFLVRT